MQSKVVTHKPFCECLEVCLRGAALSNGILNLFFHFMKLFESMCELGFII